jgi:uncharacterized protein (DUF362 family)
MTDRDMNRREFIEKAAVVGAAVAVLGAGCSKAKPAATGEPGQSSKSVAQAPSPASAPQSGGTRVARVKNPTAVKDGQPQAEAVQQLVNSAVEKLSGKTGPDAWKEYLKPTDVVGVKINCLFQGAHTHKEVVHAVVAGVLAAGVPADNIIVWDRSDGDLEKCGYTTNKGAGTKTYGTDWELKPVTSGGVTDKPAAILSKITALVNVPILKHHSMAGVSISLKNHFGSVKDPGALHGNSCDPGIADVNAIPAIKDKTRLIIVDALRPQADGGPVAAPQHQWDLATILAATDTVAVDQVGLTMLDRRRTEKGMNSLERSGAAKHIATAAARGLGTDDMGRIEIIEG